MILIKPALKKEIDAVLKVTAACNLFMRSKGIIQWTANYPSRKAFENDVLRGELFLLTLDNSIIGCIVVSSEIDEEYKPVKWLTPTSRHKYIHRLAIHPNHQKKGYAKKLMNFAEDLAKKEGCVSVRLDTFSQNKGNQQFYESRGYEKLESIFYPEQSQDPFYCYELVL